MKLTINRGELLELMGKLKAAVPKHVSLDVLQTVLLRPEKGRLVATANSLEFYLTGSCKAKVAAGGSICVAAEPVIAFLKAVTSETVALSTSNKMEKWTEKEAYWEKDASGAPNTVHYRDVQKSRRVLSVRLETGSAATTINGSRQVYEAKDFPPVPKVKEKSLTVRRQCDVEVT